MTDALSRDHANLLHSAAIAAECLEQRVTLCTAPSLTISRDELAEIADQFARVVSLLTAAHIASALRPKEPARP